MIMIFKGSELVYSDEQLEDTFRNSQASLFLMLPKLEFKH